MERLPVKNMSAEMLEELGRITNSLVEMNAARQEVNGYWCNAFLLRGYANNGL